MRRWRARNPLRAIFFTLRDNARRRGHVFKLSFLHFKQIITENGYLENKGRRKFSLTIDKKIDALGYIDGNIQVLPNIENVIKYHYGHNYKTVYYES